jgi:hypothetical protein
VRRKLIILQELEPPNENKPSSVRHFYEGIQEFMATLKNLGVQNYLDSPQTLNIMEGKLLKQKRRMLLIFIKNIRAELKVKMNRKCQWNSHKENVHSAKNRDI